jgi:hypothetical protein
MANVSPIPRRRRKTTPRPRTPGGRKAAGGGRQLHNQFARLFCYRQAVSHDERPVHLAPRPNPGEYADRERPITQKARAAYRQLTARADGRAADRDRSPSDHARGLQPIGGNCRGQETVLGAFIAWRREVCRN